jgi:hypothetical protein
VEVATLIGIPTARRALLIIAAILAATSTSLADITAPMEAPRPYFAAFNNGDMDGMAAMCAVPARQIDVSGDRGYVVVPATMTFKVQGKSK